MTDQDGRILATVYFINQDVVKVYNRVHDRTSDCGIIYNI